MLMILSSPGYRHRIRRLIIVAACVCLPLAAPARAESGHDLDQFVGGEASALIEAFGEPTLMTPDMWWYSSARRVSGGMPGVPNPAIAGGRQGITVTGAGGDYEPLTIDPDLCDMTVTIDKSNAVESIETSGPGCFEYLHELRRAAQADS